MEDYGIVLTQGDGSRLYMMSFHFYLKMSLGDFTETYKIHPLQYYANAIQEQFRGSEDPQNQNININFDDYIKTNTVYIPCCICLISKYRYEMQMETCLQSIYQLLIKNENLLKEESKLSYLIMYLINSVPIPDVENNVDFYIPHTDPSKNWITLISPKLEDFKTKENLYELFQLFDVEDIITIYRLLLLSHKIVIVDDDYARLNRVTYYFMELLYPFEWTDTYIPTTFETKQYLQTFMPFLASIDSALMQKALIELEENVKEELFIIKLIGKDKIFRFKKGKLKKTNAKKVEHLPEKIKDFLKEKLGVIKNEGIKNKNKNNIDNINLEIRCYFIEIFKKILNNIKSYVCYLDKELAFNKKLFLEGVEQKDKNFYTEFFETHVFEYSLDRYIKEEYKNLYQYCENKIKSSHETNEAFVEKYKVNKQYIIEPDYLKINEKNIKENNSRIVENIQEIDSVIKNFESKDFDIYLIPDKTEELKKQEEDLENEGIAHFENIDEDKKKDYKTYRKANILALKKEKNEKEIEKIKDIIKDFMLNIIKSEEIPMDQGNEIVLDKSSKTNVQMLINTSEGREYFILLISKGKSNVILLEEKCFDILGELIYNTLIFLKEGKDNEEKMEQIIQLTKSTKYFGISTKSKNNKNRTLWDVYGKKIRDLGYFKETSFWDIYYNVLLKKKKKKKINLFWKYLV